MDRNLSVFFGKAERDPEAPIYVGIDPGYSGALGFICGERQHYCAIDIPVIAREVTGRKRKIPEGKKRRKLTTTVHDFDYSAIHEIFIELFSYEHPVTIYLEQVPSGMGFGFAHAENMLNRAYAIWPLYLHSFGVFKIVEVAPQKWKPGMGFTNRAKGKSQSETQNMAKEECRLAALSLFPNADIQRKKDHNRAEALLLAEYGRRMEGTAGGETKEV